MEEDRSIWLCLPDSLVLYIFSFLSSKELLRSAQACKAWLRISRDELLWKSLLYGEWKIDHGLPLPPGCTSYFREFCRLRCHVPCVEVQVLREHTDQVLHVSFSHNGKLFAACSKDGTIKVWKTGPPICLKYNRAMKDLFRWQYTQFSQFNASDTLLLVSGVHFGPNSTSGEIAVFNLKDDFALQSRVLTKPYDIFGCWLNNTYLLSGNLHYLGHLSSCSALWLNKATQEVLSEQESVVMRLFKFLNINASSVRSITVANCRNLGKGEDYVNASVAGNHKRKESLSNAGRNSSGPVPDSSESELDCKAGEESDTELTASGSDIGQCGVDTGQGSSRDVCQWSSEPAMKKGGNNHAGTALPKCDSRPALHQSRSDPCLPLGVEQLRKSHAIASIDHTYQQQQQQSNQLLLQHVQSTEKSQEDLSLSFLSPSLSAKSDHQDVSSKRSSPVKRDVSDVSGLPPDTLRKSLRVGSVQEDSQPSISSEEGRSSSGGQADPDACYKRLWLRVRQAEMRRGRENYDEELFRILIEGIHPNDVASQPEENGSVWAAEGSSNDCKPVGSSKMDSSKDGTSTINRGEASACSSLQPLDVRDSLPGAVSSSRCSSNDAILSSPDLDPSSSSFTFAADSSSASDIIRAWGKHFTFGSTESLDDEPSIHYPDCCRGFSDQDVSQSNNTQQQREELPLELQQTKQESSEDPTSSSSLSDSQSQDYTHQHHHHRLKARRRKVSTKGEHQHLIFTHGSQAYTPHQIGIKRINSTMANTLRGPLGASKQPSGEESRQREEEQDQPGGLEFDKVDHVIELNGHAIGMALSPDHRYLYVNCRCWPGDYMISDPLTPPPIAQEIEIRVYDLVTLTEVKRFRGHKAFSPNDEFNFIFLDVNDFYVASGAEDRQGYVWDRYYNILLAKLPHRDVVNSVAFNPSDPEMMITASDDHTLKVWFSRHKAMIDRDMG